MRRYHEIFCSNYIDLSIKSPSNKTSLKTRVKRSLRRDDCVNGPARFFSLFFSLSLSSITFSPFFQSEIESVARKCVVSHYVRPRNFVTYYIENAGLYSLYFLCNFHRGHCEQSWLNDLYYLRYILARCYAIVRTCFHGTTCGIIEITREKAGNLEITELHNFLN